MNRSDFEIRLTTLLMMAGQSIVELALVEACFLRVEVPVNSSAEPRKYHLNA